MTWVPLAVEYANARLRDGQAAEKTPFLTWLQVDVETEKHDVDGWA